MLDEKRLEDMALGIREVAKLEDPAGRILSEIRHPNGMTLRKKTEPMVVVAIIDESRQCLLLSRNL